MTVYDAHRDLANALGDSITIPGVVPSTVIPDGVRFLKDHRDNALYRAMLSILRNAIKTSAAMDKKAASILMLRMFPNLQVTKTLSCDFVSDEGNYKMYEVQFENGDKPCYIFSILESIYTVPIPIKNHFDYTALLNSRIVERSDTFATAFEGSSLIDNSYKLNIWVPESRVDPSIYEMEPTNVRVTFLRYPEHIKDKEITDILEIEDMWYQTLISMAMQYLLVESQEIENVGQLVLLEAQQQIGGSNAGQ